MKKPQSQKILSIGLYHAAIKVVESLTKQKAVLITKY